MNDITVWNGRGFSRLARSSQLFLPARELHRDELSQDATAAAAQLTGRYTALPQCHAVQITDAYNALQVGHGYRGSIKGRHLERTPASAYRTA